MVDVVGRLRIQVADGVVADRREMDDGVEAGQVLALDVADVDAQRLHRMAVLTEDAGSKISESRPTTSWPACSSIGTSTDPI